MPAGLVQVLTPRHTFATPHAPHATTAGYLTAHRSTDGALVVNAALFPSGMRALADKIHARGLKLGVYTDLTGRSCGPGPGSYGHYEQDAKTFADDWQADYLKVDYCGTDVDRSPGPQHAAFAALRDALNNTGRAIYYSICPHAVAPRTGPGAPYDGASVYSPPLAWTASDRNGLANSLLVEYTNTFDLWYVRTVVEMWGSRRFANCHVVVSICG